MKRRPLLIAAALLWLLPALAGANNIKGYKWFPDDLPLPWAFNPDFDEPELPGTSERDEARAGFAVWQSLPDSDMRFAEAPLWPVTCSGGTILDLDGVNTLSFSDPCAELPASVLAMTVTWFFASDTMDTNGVTFSHIVESDIVFSAKLPYTDNAGAGPGCSDAYDIRGVTAHEVGHLLGLGHSFEREATMYPSLGKCDPTKATLHADDRAGAAFIYPVPGITYDVYRNCLNGIPRGLGGVFPLPLWRTAVSLPWSDTNGDVVTDLTRPLVLYQLEPDLIIYAVKSGTAVTLSRASLATSPY
jgi:hypothetical protein